MRNHLGKILPATLTLLTLSLTTLPAQAQVYATGFEAPTFSTTATANVTNFINGTGFTTVPGALAASPADQWGLIWEPGTAAQEAINYVNSLNSATVQTSVVNTGSQALQVDGAVAAQGTFGALHSYNASATSGVQTFSFDMRVGNANAQAGQWGFSLIDSNFNFVASLGFYSGIVVGGSGTSIYGLNAPTFVNYDTWANYRLNVNFDNRTFSAFVNGAPIADIQNRPLRTDITIAPGTAGIILGGQTPLGAPYPTTPERGYFDTLSAGAAPEPGTLALLALGGIALGYVGYRRRA
jgi:hypothetical protein